jgi:carboxyl-terminal processing protease
MHSKTLRNLLIILVLVIFTAGAFSGGMIVGWALPKHPNLALPGIAVTPKPQMPTTMPGQTTNLNDLFRAFWETWDVVHQQYVVQPVDDVKLMRGAINGMLASLGDKHTSYMDPDQFRQVNTQLAGEYEGIGAWVDITGEFLEITGPMPGTPAEKAGLKAGDKVVGVDGQSMKGIDGQIVLSKILGPAGSTVTLSILRSGIEQPFDVSIVRAKIIIPSIESKMLEKNVAYIRLNTFGESSASDLRKALQDLLAKQPAGLIFDLRNNGGGYLTTAVDVASQFIPQGKLVLSEVKADGTRTTFTSKGGGLATEIPLVVLVNEGTASASEITAGAIQDYLRGQLVGVTTYGKGSVQVFLPLVDQQGAIRVTTARWLTPKDRQINDQGLKPDVEIKITEGDIAAGRDPQLDKAIELLTAP